MHVYTAKLCEPHKHVDGDAWLLPVPQASVKHDCNVPNSMLHPIKADWQHMTDVSCVLCLAVAAAYSADDLLHPVSSAVLVCGFLKLRQPSVHLDGNHAHAGQHLQFCLLITTQLLLSRLPCQSEIYLLAWLHARCRSHLHLLHTYSICTDRLGQWWRRLTLGCIA